MAGNNLVGETYLYNTYYPGFWTGTGAVDPFNIVSEYRYALDCTQITDNYYVLISGGVNTKSNRCPSEDELSIGYPPVNSLDLYNVYVGKDMTGIGPVISKATYAKFTGHTHYRGTTTNVEFGFCVSTSPNPTIYNNKYPCSGGEITVSYADYNLTKIVDNLVEGTYYYVRTYILTPTYVQYSPVEIKFVPNDFYVGRSYGGGIIAAVETGYDSNGDRYNSALPAVLIISSSDVSNLSVRVTCKWGAQVNMGANAVYGPATFQSVIGAGKTNTNTITSKDSNTAIAAWRCKTHNASGYSDWYLPSLGEMNRIATNIPSSMATTQVYWSSSEASSSSAWFMNYDLWSESRSKGNFYYAKPCRYLIY